MTRAFARSADRLAGWQSQLIAEALAAQRRRPSTRRTPAPCPTCRPRAAAAKLAVLADRLEPLLVYAWRRHLSAAIARMLADADPTSPTQGVTRSWGSPTWSTSRRSCVG